MKSPRAGISSDPYLRKEIPMLRIALVALVALLVSFPASAEKYEGLNQKLYEGGSPDSLSIWVLSDKECPFTQEQLEAAVRGEIVRARIKPQNKNFDGLELTYQMTCMGVYRGGTHEGYIGARMLSFEEWGPAYGSRGSFQPLQGSYGGVMFSGLDGAKEYFLSAAKADIEKALTDFIESNME